jgi:hypothetical protein
MHRRKFHLCRPVSRVRILDRVRTFGRYWVISPPQGRSYAHPLEVYAHPRSPPRFHTSLSYLHVSYRIVPSAGSLNTVQGQPSCLLLSACTSHDSCGSQVANHAPCPVSRRIVTGSTSLCHGRWLRRPRVYAILFRSITREIIMISIYTLVVRSCDCRLSRSSSTSAEPEPAVQALIIYQEAARPALISVAPIHET